jgi:hypothetical protein
LEAKAMQKLKEKMKQKGGEEDINNFSDDYDEDKSAKAKMDLKIQMPRQTIYDKQMH